MAVPSPEVPSPLPAGKPKPFSGKRLYLAAAGTVVVAVGLTLALPGGWQHARSLFGGRSDIPAAPKPQHTVRGLIELRDKKLGTGTLAEDYEAYRIKQVLLLKSREVLQRTLGDPAVAKLETTQEAADPLEWLKENIQVEAVAGPVLAVTLRAEKIDEAKIIVDTLMKIYVDVAVATERRERTEYTRKLEKLEQDLMAELDSLERHMKTMPRTNEGNSSEDAVGPRIRELEGKIAQLKDETIRQEVELKLLDRQLGAFKFTDKSLADLRTAGVPEKLLEKLKPLVGRDFAGRQAFVDELAKLLAKEEADRFRASICNAAVLPSAQLPLIAKAELDRAIDGDPRIATLTKSRDEIEKLYEQVNRTTADLKSPTLLDLHEMLKKANQELDVKRQEIRKAIVAALQAKELLTIRQRVTKLDELIAIERETLALYKEELGGVKKERALYVQSQLAVAEMSRACRPMLEKLEQVRRELLQVRTETRFDTGPRVREPAQLEGSN